jgi:small subunit ribosomal protein S5
MRAVFEALGLHDVVSKSVGTPNYHNVVRATVEALRSVSSPRQVATKLGKKLSEIVSRRETSSKNAEAELIDNSNS